MIRKAELHNSLAGTKRQSRLNDKTSLYSTGKERFRFGGATDIIMKKVKTIFQKNSVILLTATLCCVLWGSAYPCIKIGYELFSIRPEDTFGKFLFAGFRFTLAGVLVIAFASLIRKRLVVPKKGHWGGIILLGLVQTTLQYLFFYIGLSHTTGVKGAILNAFGTFIAVILAHFCYKNDRMNWAKGIGCAVGLAGVVLVNLNGAGAESGGFSFLGEGFMLLSACVFAVSFIISKVVSAQEDAMVVTGYNLFLGGLVLILLGILGGASFSDITPKAVGLLLYMALLSSVAFTLWTTLLKHNRVGKISVYNFLVPVFGTILSALFLGESIWSWQNILALVLVCAGIYIVNRKKEEPGQAE